MPRRSRWRRPDPGADETEIRRTQLAVTVPPGGTGADQPSVTKNFGGVEAATLLGRIMRHDHGSNDRSQDLQNESGFMGIKLTRKFAIASKPNLHQIYRIAFLQSAPKCFE